MEQVEFSMSSTQILSSCAVCFPGNGLLGADSLGSYVSDHLYTRVTAFKSWVCRVPGVGA